MRFAKLVGLMALSGAFGCSVGAPKSAVAPEPVSPAVKTEASVAIPKEKASAESVAKNDKKDKDKDGKDLDARGNMWGDEIGDSFGQSGLGLTGVGEGGGGRGEGVGLGSLGTLGHGAGTGTGQGFGSGSGRLAGSHTNRAKISAATATTTGAGLPPEVISRIVRQNFGGIRLCYEKAMAKDPTLGGKVALKFTIDAQGAVSHAAVGDTTIADADMVTCLVAVVKKLSFPAPENGGTMVVTYPFQFAPGDS